MNKMLFVFAVLFAGAVVGTGCSTTANFKIPEGHQLMVTDRVVTPDANGDWKTSPFFWSSVAGADFRLKDKNGKVVRTGKLKTNFRVVSIFWPPAALIYWPVGFRAGQYDLTQSGDGYMVTDNTPLPAASALNTPAPANNTAKVSVKSKTKKKKKEEKTQQE